MGTNSKLRQLIPQAGILHFAAEYPISVHDTVSELTDYEFLIALIAVRKRNYKELFIQERRPDRYRIVDSGIFEDSENPLSATKLYETALELDADEVVAVDHIGEKQKTLDAVGEFLDLDSEFPFKVMAVPQGKDFIEWFECYDDFLMEPKIDVIGLTYYKHPAGLEEVGMKNFQIDNKYEAARLALLHLLAGGTMLTNCGLNVKEQFGVGVHTISKPIHILGCGHPRAIQYYRQFPFVRSIDTSFPVQLGIEGRAFHLDSLKPKFKMNFNADLVRAEKSLIAENTLRFAMLCKGRNEAELWETVDRLAQVRLGG